MRQAKPHATISLTLFTVDHEPLLLLDPQGDLPRDPAAYARLLHEIAAALQRHAQNVCPADRSAV